MYVNMCCACTYMYYNQIEPSYETNLALVDISIFHVVNWKY